MHAGRQVRSRVGLGFEALQVALDLTPDGSARAALAGRLARRFEATLSGVAGRRLPTSASEDHSGECFSEGSVADELRLVQESFYRDAGPNKVLSTAIEVADPTRQFLSHAAGADLLIVGRPGDASKADRRFALDAGDVVLEAGRPVLIVPPGCAELNAHTVAVAWKDCREARRALRDALPFLQQASEVILLAVTQSDAEEPLCLAQEYLERHAVRSAKEVRWPTTDPVTTEILDAAEKLRADLIVAGAYGHSRMREWIFGGVTQTLLARSPVCCLLSH